MDLPTTSPFNQKGTNGRLLVTGGAGFIGANLAIALRDRHPGLEVIALDNLRRRGSELNLPRLRAAGVEFVHGDIRNEEDLAVFDDLDVMIECSAEPSVLAGFGASRQYMINANLVGTINCLETALRAGAFLVFLSTSRVYPVAELREVRFRETDIRFEMMGEQPMCGCSERGISESFPIAGERTLYGATKLCSEHLIEEYAAFGLQSVVNRCGVVAGPWQLGKVDQGVVTYWLLRHHFADEITYIGYGGSGRQVRDVLHVDDLADLVELQLIHRDRVVGHTFNVGGGSYSSVSLVELTALCGRLTGRELKINREPKARPGDVPLYVTDNGLATQTLGWSPTRSIDTILADTNQWIVDHQDLVLSALGGAR